MEPLIAHRIWLLGQDDQYLRPKVLRVRTAVTVAALLDLVHVGAAVWTDDGTHISTSSCPSDAPALIKRWSHRLESTANGSPLKCVYAIDCLAPHVWDEVGDDAAEQGFATNVARPIRRWMTPRHRPDPATVTGLRSHLRDVVLHDDKITDPVDEATLAAGWTSNTLEELLSTTAFSDSSILEPAGAKLASSPLVGRLTDAVALLSVAGWTEVPTATS